MKDKLIRFIESELQNNHKHRLNLINFPITCKEQLWYKKEQTAYVEGERRAYEIIKRYVEGLK